MLPLTQMGAPAGSGAAAPAAQTFPAAAYQPAQSYPNTAYSPAPIQGYYQSNAGYGSAPGQPSMIPAAPQPYTPIPAPQPYMSNSAPQPYMPNSAAAQPSYAPVQQFTPQRLAPVPQGAGGGVVDQMLLEASPGGCYGGAPHNGYGSYSGPVYSGPVSQYGQAAQGQFACQSAGRGDLWYGSPNALFMSRSGSNRVWTSYETNNNPNQLMNTDIPLAWQPGGEIRIGRQFGCGQWAVEGVYWSLADFTGHASVSNVNGVSTPLAVDQIDFAGTLGTAYFDNAGEHDLWRDDSLQNVEVNVVRNLLVSNCNCCDGSPWDLSFLVGARYFRFEDSILLGALQAGCTWGQDGGAMQAYLGDTVVNNLYGVQVGFDAAYRFSNCWRICVGSKFGCFDNHMTGQFKAYRGDGVNALPDPSSGITGTYPVDSTKDGVSFMAELNLGLRWDFHENWSAQIGYRVVGLTGIALSDSQIPFYACDIPEESFIKSADCLVLHGAYAGISFCF
jgi:hypothetical protein